MANDYTVMYAYLPFVWGGCYGWLLQRSTLSCMTDLMTSLNIPYKAWENWYRTKQESEVTTTRTCRVVTLYVNRH